ncbi:MAG TPA: hypothetical protein VFA05_04720 [Gaiellaceae bacterium]|nr:hypothetical protein [Gaiellaceae bacterium]
MGYARSIGVDRTMLPVYVTASPVDAGAALLELLSDEYGATGERSGDEWMLTIVPIDSVRRGTIIYRVIQASRTVDARFPDAVMHLITEDGNRWRLPPPSL